MKHEVIDNDIIFTVDTDQIGKWAAIHVLYKVLEFWKNVAFYGLLKRQSFDSIIIKINRVGIFNESPDRIDEP